MADHFYGINLGGMSPDDVATGTSTTSKKVELRVEDSVTGISGNKGQLLKLIELIKRKIVESNAPA